ncbi:MAG: hypothetical protein KDB07_03335 [Planctomycetes bacterium]|nr:hypothetical protein [Planctomycetota bacterium]
MLLANKLAGGAMTMDVTSEQSRQKSMEQAKALGIWEGIKDINELACCVAVNKNDGSVSSLTPQGSRNLTDYRAVMDEVN